MQRNMQPGTQDKPTRITCPACGATMGTLGPGERVVPPGTHGAAPRALRCTECAREATLYVRGAQGQPGGGTGPATGAST